MTPRAFSVARIYAPTAAGSVPLLVPEDDNPEEVIPELQTGAPVWNDVPGGDPTYVAPGAGSVQLLASATPVTIEYLGPVFAPLSGGGSSIVTVVLTARAELAGCAVPASSWQYRVGAIGSPAGSVWSGFNIGNANGQCVSNGNIGVPFVAPFSTPVPAGYAVSGPGQWRQVQYTFNVPRDGVTSWRPYMAWVYISGGNLPQLGFAVRYIVRT